MMGPQLAQAELGALALRIESGHRGGRLASVALVGVTPRAGCSTLCTLLRQRFAEAGLSVAVVASQPTLEACRQAIADAAAPLVLLDGGSVSTAAGLAGAVAADTYVLVVPAGAVTQPAVVHARQRLEQAGAHVLGAVLNRRRLPLPGFLYKRL